MAEQDKIEMIKLNYEIPNSIKAEVFGPPMWNALHDIVSKIPCSICKPHAIALMQFIHDLKNYQLNKEIKYKENFIKHINYIASLKNKPLIMK